MKMDTQSPTRKTERQIYRQQPASAEKQREPCKALANKPLDGIKKVDQNAEDRHYLRGYN